MAGMSEKPRLEVVLFDLDDTLWDLCVTMQRAHDAWAEAVAALPGGGAFVEACQDWALWTDASSAFATVKKERPELAKDLPQVRREAMRRACLAAGGDPEVLVEPGFAAWTARRNQPVFFNDSLPLLRMLKSKGITIGAVSDGFADLATIPELPGLLDFAVFARDVGASKPSPEIFKVALQRAEERSGHACDPASCLMVGDSYAKDVLGGIGAGMRAIWFDNPESFPRQLCGQAVPQDTSACEARVHGIADLAALLEAELSSASKSN